MKKSSSHKIIIETEARIAVLRTTGSYVNDVITMKFLQLERNYLECDDMSDTSDTVLNMNLSFIRFILANSYLN